jgi:hypothetical protein
MSERQNANAPVMQPRRPRWPEPGYDIAAEITDLTDWSVNPDVGLVGRTPTPSETAPLSEEPMMTASQLPTLDDISRSG